MAASSEWDEYADGWDDDTAARTYAGAAFDSLQALAESHGFVIDGTVALDFGCGTGLLTERLADVCDRIDAVDSSPAMLAVLDAKVECRGWRHVKTMRDVASSEAAYDLIVCSSVCAFLDDYPGTAAQLVDRLRPGGLFAQWDWERNPDDDEPHGMTRGEIRETLTDAGLTSVTADIAFRVDVEGETMAPLIGAGRKVD